jgi:ribonuclease HI
MTDKLLIYTDGGARGNPGPAAIGVAIYELGRPGDPIKTLGKVLGTTTNNEAEYKAVIAALEEAKLLKAETLEFLLDSELVVKQLSGKYKIRQPRLADLAMDAFRLMNSFKSVTFKHIPREKNKLADQLVNDALDKAGF